MSPAIAHPKHKFHPSRFLPIVMAGLVIAIIEVAAQISMALLIFSGSLSGFVSNGIGLILVGSFIALIITTLTSSYVGMISVNQDIPAAILAVMAADIAARMAPSASLDEIYLTIAAAIIVSSLLTGLVFIFQGYFKLGDLLRFLPYPVVGGFLAGTGWLLVSGGLAAMAGISPELGQLPLLFQPDVWLRWLPGAVLAVVMLLILNRYSHYLIMPGLILGSAALFYLLIWVLNIPLAQVSQQGWLLGPFPAGGLWQPFSPADLFKVNWAAIFAQGGNFAALLIISTIALLLNTSGLELTVRQDIHLDQELTSSGLASIGSGLAGGLVSYPALSLSILGAQIGGRSRLLGLMVAAVVGGVLYLGPNLLAWTPKMLFGGLLMFLGLSLLDEWLYRAWFKFSRLDFFIILAILLVIATFGFLQGVALGVGLAMVLFVVNYSRINVVKHTLSGANYQSRVTRPASHREVLTQQGAEIYILQLQGFIFFGTANTLLNQVRQRLKAAESARLRFVVLDFRQVTGLDSTTTLSFNKMKQLAQAQQIALVFCTPSAETTLPGHSQSLAKFFNELMTQDSSAENIHLFPDLDRGLEWCENQLLAAAGLTLTDQPKTLHSQLKDLLPSASQLDNVMHYLERLEVEAGYYLIKQGALPDDLFFIESGQVTAQLEFPDRPPMRLETMRGGRVVGEIGFYSHKPRTAAVIADEPSIIYRLSRQTLTRMEQNHPEAASAFHQAIIRLVADRLTHLINTVNALQR